MRVKFDKDNDGFSMVELLAVLVIISLVFSICYILSNYLIEKSKREAFEQSKEIVMDVIKDYHEEFKNSKDWVEGYNGDNKLSFCISIHSLINSGYYKGDEDVVDEWKDKYIIHAVEDNDGYNYELVDINNSEVCDVTIDDMGISNASGDYELSNDDSEVANLKYSVTEKEDFVYTVNNIIKANILPEIDGEIKSYITLVLDRSGSMSEQYSKEENAARCLVARMLGAKEETSGLTEKQCKIGDFSGLKNTEIALVEYAKKVNLSRDFSSSVFSLPFGIYNNKKNPNAIFHDQSYSGIDTGTNTAYALAYSMMLNQNKSNDGKKFIILLYDGVPCSSIYYTDTENKIKHFPSNSQNTKTNKWNTYVNNINTSFFENFATIFEDGKIKVTDNNKCGLDNRAGKDLVAVSNYLKENTDITLIVVGYKEDFKDGFKVLSSQDNELCENSSYSQDINKDGEKEWYCYYKAEENVLTELFETLSSNLRTKVKIKLFHNLF